MSILIARFDHRGPVDLAGGGHLLVGQVAYVEGVQDVWEDEDKERIVFLGFGNSGSNPVTSSADFVVDEFDLTSSDTKDHILIDVWLSIPGEGIFTFSNDPTRHRRNISP